MKNSFLKKGIWTVCMIFFLSISMTACTRVILQKEEGPVVRETEHRQEPVRKVKKPRRQKPIKKMKKDKAHRPHIPPGHMPPPGKCRIWYPDRPAGQQPPPGNCRELRKRLPQGAWLIEG